MGQTLDDIVTQAEGADLHWLRCNLYSFHIIFHIQGCCPKHIVEGGATVQS